MAYVSSSIGLLTVDALHEILVVSRRKNTERSITGMLLYKDGNILQVLEGPPEAVDTIFSRIQADHRHFGVIRLYRKSVAQRDFPEWSMGFRDLNSKESQAMPGFSEFLAPDFDVRTLQPSRALRLLNLFKENQR